MGPRCPAVGVRWAVHTVTPLVLDTCASTVLMSAEESLKVFRKMTRGICYGRFRSRVSRVAIAVTSATVFLSLSTGAGVPQQPTSDGQQRSDAANCGVPLKVRTGGWLCIDLAASKALLEQQAASRAKAAGRATIEKSSASFCVTTGCWDVVSVTQADYSSVGNYGYGRTVLGTATFSFTDKTSGNSTISYPNNWKASGTTYGVVMRVERLTMASSQSGTWMVPRLVRTGTKTGTINAGVGTSLSKQQWTATQTKGTMWRDVNWSVPDYPGRWYVMAKSNVFRATFSGSTNLGLRFSSDSDLPTGAANAGYNP